MQYFEQSIWYSKQVHFWRCCGRMAILSCHEEKTSGGRLIMALPLIATAVAVTVGSKIAKKVAKVAY